MHKKVVLCILDGFGIGDQCKDNAIYNANTPNLDKIFEKYPNSKIVTHGVKVGLPEGQMGNSEVGHMTISAGRVIEQDLLQINRFLENEVLENKLLQKLLFYHKNHGAIHIFALNSDGGIHSHIEHLKFFIKFFGQQNIKVHLHLVTDGRDCQPYTAKNFMKSIYQLCKIYPSISISTISGRFYAMDRDQRWERTKGYFDALCGIANKNGICELLNSGISDEFIKPTIVSDFNGIKDGDSFLMLNFRADRIKQISSALLDKDFKYFERPYFPALKYSLSLKDGVNEKYSALISNNNQIDTLGEVLSKNNLSQLRVAETEKYPHVTYFFNAGNEEIFPKEERIMISSPKVKTYDLCPQMSALEISKVVCNNIALNKFDFILVNFANADMVGHTGNLKATIKAIEYLDQCIGQIYNAISQHDYCLIITADHGNAEDMETETESILTSHTKNPVPLCLINYNIKHLKDGSLADIAPTILSILNIKIPESMTGRNLITNG
jgi:2,3-bisphosphoglycerate-independent phosphoglycerate mutase